MKLWLNGSIMEAEEAKISPFDHGFLYGLGVFETFRTYNGQPFLLGSHLKRLHESLQEMGIHFSLNITEAADMIDNLLEANGGEDGYFRLNVSAGIRDIGLFPEPYDKPTVMLLQKKLMTQPAGGKKGQWLTLPRNTPETAIRLKSHHYFNNIAGRREVADPGTEGLFLTKEGYVAEGITSNIFWIKEDTLYTPALETGILAGVTRSLVLSLARKSGLQIEEGLYLKEQLMQAEEAFITNSIQEIVPLTAINGQGFKSSRQTSQLLEGYKKVPKSRLYIEEF
ncbi:aminodeoxychorismate lyase [Jeotgalibacillus proteolyticus]|uniref:4-amino-4-deoxychorismate lyase n=1 Tax=Jeotgalibacillus proteolyticus TaxID=2082395 RepID=A0A2S5G6F0_9BACL|nr:aminodeoxychorismate lyase [Jeotgalibacillus proteolyticus]PPA68559.1 4-amino-4-deoxychorismate lyase [Jeotgalibacillus proteolyticus]